MKAGAEVTGFSSYSGLDVQNTGSWSTSKMEPGAAIHPACFLLLNSSRLLHSRLNWFAVCGCFEQFQHHVEIHDVRTFIESICDTLQNGTVLLHRLGTNRFQTL
jgi:hypothetical protein